MNRPLRPLLVLTLLAAGLAGLPAHAQITPLPSVPEPAENPLTAEKAVLGKILFWDQQLSTDNTVACGLVIPRPTGEWIRFGRPTRGPTAFSATQMI